MGRGVLHPASRPHLRAGLSVPRVGAEQVRRPVAPARALDDIDTPAAAAGFGIAVPPPGLEDSPA